MKVPLNVGMIFDFGKPLPKVDMASEHYIDYHPAETQRQVDQMLSWFPTPQGELDLTVVIGKLREFVEGDPKKILFTIDSCSPIA